MSTRTPARATFIPIPILIGILLTAFALIAWAGMYLSTPSDNVAEFAVSVDESSDSIIRRLKSEGVIHSVLLFRRELNKLYGEANFHPGVFDLSGSASYLEIIERLTQDTAVLKSLVFVSAESIGTHCATGGQRAESGIDANDDGALGLDEVTATSYICNGTEETMGETGASAAKSLVWISDEPVGPHCANGGQKIEGGIDADNNGVLEPGEVTTTSFVCNGAAGTTGSTGAQGAAGSTGATGTQGAAGSTGATGTQGAAGTTGSTGATGTQGAAGTTGATGSTGAAGTTGSTGTQGAAGTTGATGATGARSLMNMTDEPAGSNCANGGQRIDGGIDADNSGVLEPGEVATTSFVCNGAAGTTGAQGTTGLTGTTSLVGITDEPSGSNCTYGGKMMQAGPDTNDNGVLDPAEVTATSYVCNGATGTTGATGATGPSGLSGATLVTGATATSAAGAPKGTQVTATATCPAGKVLLGGGARVTTTDPTLARAVLVSDYPSSTTTRTAVGMVSDSNLGSTNTLSVTAYALCSQ